MAWIALLLAALTPSDLPDQDWWDGFVREVERTDSYDEYLDNRGVERQSNGDIPLTAPAASWELYHLAHPEWEPSCGEDLDGPLLPNSYTRVEPEPRIPERVRIEAEVVKDMPTHTYEEPADITGWLDSGEYLDKYQVAVNDNGHLSTAGVSTDGVDDYLEATNFPQFSNRSFVGWVNLAETQNSDFTRVIQRSYNVFNVGFRIMVHESSRIEWWADGGTGDSRRADQDYTPDTWMHVAGTVADDGSSYELYINGTQQTSTRSVAPVGSGTDLLSIGRTVNEDSNYLDGKIADFRVYSRVLSAQEIDDHYQGNDISGTNLEAWYKFTAGTGSTATDSAGANDATLYGASWVEDGWRAALGWDPTLSNEIQSTQVDWVTGAGTVEGKVALSETDPTSLEGDGVDDYGDTAAKVSTPSDYTVMVWVKVLSKVTDDYGQWFVTNRNTSDDRTWQIRWSYGSQTLRIEHFAMVDSTLTTFAAVALNTDPTLGQWYHLAFTYNESSQELKAYLNGAWQETTTGVPPSRDDSDSLRILDATFASDALQANAQLSHLKIWTRTLDATEIDEQVYNTPDTSDADLLNWWPLDEGSGSTATDNAGNNDITLTGTTWRPGQSGLYRAATNGGSIPGLAAGDTLGTRKIYLRTDLATSDAVLESTTLTITTAAEAKIAAFWRMQTIGSGTH